ncbi:MAG: hypothetical protein AAB877_00255 [Patescibacteria group bacterium]
MPENRENQEVQEEKIRKDLGEVIKKLFQILAESEGQFRFSVEIGANGITVILDTDIFYFKRLLQ